MSLEIIVENLISQYVYQPEKVYLMVTLMMLAGSFGLPIPEEAALVSVGLVAYMGSRPDLYPPPFEGAPHVDGHWAAVVCFFAVVGSDLTVYLLGRFLGPKILQNKKFQRILKPELLTKIKSWTDRYGIWASGIFRFTPALRFPGFLSCGIFEIPLWKFLLVDGSAALLSVPTQVILVYMYGDTILKYFKKFKLVVFGIILAVVLFFVVRKIWRRFRKKGVGVVPS